MIITIITLFCYLFLTNMVPSLLRAFIMFFLAFIFLRSNVKVLSFQTLLITFLIIVTIYPKYIFSISLWFSVTGVFYIFLYIKYFKNLPKIFSLYFLIYGFF